MTAVNVSHFSTRGDGKEVVKATIISNTVPGTLPTTGSGIKGMTENQIFAPFSLLYVVGTGAVYIANEDGTFVAQ